MMEPGGAPWVEVSEAVGPVQFDIGCPEVRVGLDPMESWRAYKQRTVTITLGRAGTIYRDLSILRGLLTRARDEALTQCRIEEQGFRGVSDRGDVGPAEIYGSPHEGAPSELLAYTEGYSQLYGFWDQIKDKWADRELQLKEEAEEAARANEIAERERAQTLARQAAAAERALREAEQAEAQRRFTSAFWGWVRIVGAAALLLWLFLKREAIARWYYALQPHPATDVVHSAIHRGGTIDGDLYERILRPIPGSAVERHVRANQARELTDQLRQHEA